MNSINEKGKGTTVTISTSSISIEGMGRDKEAQLNISISLPVLSVTGTEAIFFTRHEAGLTGGGDYAFYARRSKRGWKIISFKSFTVA